MDFRIIDMEHHQILLERLEDDGRWVVVLSVYIERVNRFDEWIPGDDFEHVRTLIATYSLEQARQFLDRAWAWWDKEFARQQGPRPVGAVAGFLQRNTPLSERGGVSETLYIDVAGATRAQK